MSPVVYKVCFTCYNFEKHEKINVFLTVDYYLNQNSQAVKESGPPKGQDEKRCEIQGGGQKMAVMVG